MTGASKLRGTPNPLSFLDKEMNGAYQMDYEARPTPLRLRTASQFSNPMMRVTPRSNDLLKSIPARRDRHINTPSTANSGPPGKRNVAASGCFFRSTGTDAHTSP